MFCLLLGVVLTVVVCERVAVSFDNCVVAPSSVVASEPLGRAQWSSADADDADRRFVARAMTFSNGSAGDDVVAATTFVNVSDAVAVVRITAAIAVTTAANSSTTNETTSEVVRFANRRCAIAHSLADLIERRSENGSAQQFAPLLGAQTVAGVALA